MSEKLKKKKPQAQRENERAFTVSCSNGKYGREGESQIQAPFMYSVAGPIGRIFFDSQADAHCWAAALNAAYEAGRKER